MSGLEDKDGGYDVVDDLGEETVLARLCDTNGIVVLGPGADEPGCVCTGSAHLGATVITCTNPIHRVEERPVYVVGPQVGDLVRYVPNISAAELDDTWRERVERDSLVIREPKTGVPHANFLVRTLFTPEEQSRFGWGETFVEWACPAERLRLVARANYRRLDG